MLYSESSVKRKSLSVRLKRLLFDNFQLYLMMLPGLTAVFIFSYIPLYGIQIAFKDFRTSLGIWGSEWIGLEHFRRFLNFPEFKSMLQNTIFISLYSLATFPLGIILSLLINEIRNIKYKKIVQMVSYAPHFLSTVVLCGMLFLFLGRSNGLINNLIFLLGGERIAFMEKPSAFYHIYVWSDVWQNIGWSTIIYLAALSNVSPELVEAAIIDGAGRLRIIWHINLPVVLPTFIILFILSTGKILNIGYEKILLLRNPLNNEASRVISSYVYEIGLVRGQFSYSTAINLFNNVINLIVIMIVNSIAKRISEVSLW